MYDLHWRMWKVRQAFRCSSEETWQFKQNAALLILPYVRKGLCGAIPSLKVTHRTLTLEHVLVILIWGLIILPYDYTKRLSPPISYSTKRQHFVSVNGFIEVVSLGHLCVSDVLPLNDSPLICVHWIKRLALAPVQQFRFSQAKWSWWWMFSTGYTTTTALPWTFPSAIYK